MLRIRSPFRPSARPDSNAPAFPPNVLQNPPTLSSADYHKLVLCPCRQPTHSDPILLCVPLHTERLSLSSESSPNEPRPCFAGGSPLRHFFSSVRTCGSPGVLLDFFLRVTAESTSCAITGWSGLPTVLRPRPCASCLHSVFVHQPAHLPQTSFKRPYGTTLCPSLPQPPSEPRVELSS